MPIISTVVNGSIGLTTGDLLVITRDGGYTNAGGTTISVSGTEYDVDIRISGEVFARNYGVILSGTSTAAYDASGDGQYNVWIGETGVVANSFASQDAIAAWGADNVFYNAGEIYGMTYGLRNTGDGAQVTNSGSIIGVGASVAESAGVRLNGVTGQDTLLLNSGFISGEQYGVFSQSNALYLNNSGTITTQGFWGVYAASGGSLGGAVASAGQTIINSGTIEGGVYVNSYLASNSILNTPTGLIVGLVQTHDEYDRVENAGRIQGDVNLEGDDDLLINDGVISGTVNGGFGNDTVRGSGDYGGNVDTSSGSDLFWLEGGRVSGDMIAGIGDDSVRNSGVVAGDVDLGTGNDVYIGWGGTVGGTIYGGLDSDLFYVDDPDARIDGGSGIDVVFARNDVTLLAGVEETYLLGAAHAGVTGSNTAEIITGNGGNNAVDAGGGNDTVYGGTGNDDLAGGLGLDELKGGAGNDTLTGGDDNDTIAGQSGDDEAYGDAGDDLVAGNIGNDYLDGGADNDRVLGQGGDDTLLGGAGEDVLIGGAGADDIYGGEGRDILQGKSGADDFIFETAADIWDGALGDRISDFESGADRIDVSGIGDESAFDFLGTAAFTAGGGQEIRYVVSGAGTTVVYFDEDGDGNTDATLYLAGVTGGVVASDFVL